MTASRDTQPRARRGLRRVAAIVNRTAATGLLAFAAACASAEPNAPVLDAGRIVAAQAGADVTLAPGETAELSAPGMRVKFNRLTSDSRCPTKALIQCVWAGSVIVELQAAPLASGRPVETRTLETVAGRDTATMVGQLVRLVRVSPDKETTEEIPSNRYRIVLQVGATK